MKVGIDLDGVCYDFAGSLREYLGRSLGDDPRRVEPKRWEFYEDWGFDVSEFLEHCHAGVDQGVVFSHGDPFSGVQEAFMRIKASGHTIHIVTDRSFGSPGASATATLKWLDQHGLAFDSITFASDKTIANVDVMVDDKAENYHALTDAGVDTWLLTRAWNKHVDTNRRVLDLLHFSEVIQ